MLCLHIHDKYPANSLHELTFEVISPFSTPFYTYLFIKMHIAEEILITLAIILLLIVRHNFGYLRNARVRLFVQLPKRARNKVLSSICNTSDVLYFSTRARFFCL